MKRKLLASVLAAALSISTMCVMASAEDEVGLGGDSVYTDDAVETDEVVTDDIALYDDIDNEDVTAISEDEVATDGVEEDETVVTTEVAVGDSDKGSPDTGVEGVAAVAGLAIVAAGTVILTRKRK